MEWRPADFSGIGPLEICLLLGIGLALLRGITLAADAHPAAAGLLHMALAQGRAAEILALLAPLVLAAPLAGRSAAPQARSTRAQTPPSRLMLVAAGADAVGRNGGLCSAATASRPMPGTPVAAVAQLKKLNFTRVFNDYDFGGYLIHNGVAPFIDGRTELYGEKFFVDHNAASGLMEPENLFRLLDQYKIEATLMRTQSAATKLLDHMDGWQKIYSDEIATIHVRKAGALHAADPAVEGSLRP